MKEIIINTLIFSIFILLLFLIISLLALPMMAINYNYYDVDNIFTKVLLFFHNPITLAVIVSFVSYKLGKRDIHSCKLVYNVNKTKIIDNENRKLEKLSLKYDKKKISKLSLVHIPIMNISQLPLLGENMDEGCINIKLKGANILDYNADEKDIKLSNTKDTVKVKFKYLHKGELKNINIFCEGVKDVKLIAKGKTRVVLEYGLDLDAEKEKIIPAIFSLIISFFVFYLFFTDFPIKENYISNMSKVFEYSFVAVIFLSVGFIFLGYFFKTILNYNSYKDTE